MSIFLNIIQQNLKRSKFENWRKITRIILSIKMNQLMGEQLGKTVVFLYLWLNTTEIMSESQQTHTLLS